MFPRARHAPHGAGRVSMIARLVCAAPASWAGASKSGNLRTSFTHQPGEFGEHQPGEFGEHWSMLVNFGPPPADLEPNLPQFGRTLTNFVDAWPGSRQIWPIRNSVRIWPTIAQIGRAPPTGAWKMPEHQPRSSCPTSFAARADAAATNLASIRRACVHML